MDKSLLHYTDEGDRALGLAGMMIAVTVWDSEESLVTVTLDSNPGEGFVLNPGFHFSGNPRMSAREAWRRMVHELEISSALLVANAMCRAYVGRRHRVSSAANALLKALVRDEGRSVCSLEDDEIDALYDKVYANLDRVFTSPGVATLANGFASHLQSQRSLSGIEAVEVLRTLNAR